MISNLQFIVSEAERGTRLDRVVLARSPGSTRALVGAAFEDGAVFVDGKRAAKSATPVPGSVVTIAALAETSDLRVVPQPGGALGIVYQDAHLVALDKPRGQPCHPLKIGETDTLANALVAAFPETDGIGGDPLIPGLLHRIDAGTSGLILAARSAAAFAAVRTQFTAQTVRKTYLAIVHGRVPKPGGVSGLLAHSSSFRGRMRVVAGSRLPKGERAMFAETFYTPLTCANDQTLLEVVIYTGVTHQIRCHLASVGFPIVGDATYGAPASALPARRHLLHAAAAELRHPVTGATLVLTAPPPADMARHGA